MPEELPRIEYVEARRVLLDALDAMRAHLDALILVGAQAVYLRTQGRLSGYQAFTTDADIVLDPTKLGPIPPLGQAMIAAGFTLTPEPGVWEANFNRAGIEDQIVVPVDLIVPEQLAPRAGRRAARLPGEHGKTTARKSAGLEGAVVDNSPVTITAFEPDDVRTMTINVAGPGALLVAKAHKLGERLATPGRLLAKDAGDIYRLFDATAPTEMSATLTRLLDDERSSRATTLALEYIERLFATPTSTGTRLAVDALRGTLPETTVATASTGYVRIVLDELHRE